MTNILPTMEINNCSLDQLLEQASQSPRLRQSKDMRTSAADSSQRMLNALMPGTQVPVHRHRLTDETVICLKGKIDEIIFEETTDAEGNNIEGVAKFIFAKHRSGATGDVTLRFEGKYARFQNWDENSLVNHGIVPSKINSPADNASGAPSPFTGGVSEDQFIDNNNPTPF